MFYDVCGAGSKTPMKSGLWARNKRVMTTWTVGSWWGGESFMMECEVLQTSWEVQRRDRIALNSADDPEEWMVKWKKKCDVLPSIKNKRNATKIWDQSNI